MFERVPPVRPGAAGVIKVVCPSGESNTAPHSALLAGVTGHCARYPPQLNSPTRKIMIKYLLGGRYIQ